MADHLKFTPENSKHINFEMQLHQKHNCIGNGVEKLSVHNTNLQLLGQSPNSELNDEFVKHLTFVFVSIALKFHFLILYSWTVFVERNLN